VAEEALRLEDGSDVFFEIDGTEWGEKASRRDDRDCQDDSAMGGHAGKDAVFQRSSQATRSRHEH
jgi:hypothetical protein